MKFGINENGLFVRKFEKLVSAGAGNRDGAGSMAGGPGGAHYGAPPRNNLPPPPDVSEFFARGPGGCKLVRADELPGACYRDNCGRTYIRAGGSWVEIKSPNTIKEKVMSIVLSFDTSAVDVTFSTEIQPETPYFVPRSMILDKGPNPAGTGYTLNHLAVTQLKIGTRDQSISKLGNTTGAQAYSGFHAGVFGPNTFNNLIDLDPATPQLGVKVTGVLRADVAVPNTTIDYTIALFGITFESLAALLLG